MAFIAVRRIDMKNVLRLSATVVVFSLLLTSVMGFAADKKINEQAGTAVESTSPVASKAGINLNTRKMPSSVLNSDSKIFVQSTDANGNCPSGATLLSSCSGTYPNGNSWSITPCCRTVTE